MEYPTSLGKYYLLAEHGDSYNTSLVLANASQDIYLYKADCLDLMDKVLAKHPNGVFDAIFADPPYQLQRLSELPDLVMGSRLLNEQDSVFILEHGKSNHFSEHPNFSEMRVYGSVHFTFFKP